MNLIKHKRLKNPKLIKEMTGGYCEVCGKPAQGQPHHVKTVGSGGPDMRENLIQLSCANCCHDKAHRGIISKTTLLTVISRREGITVEECKRRIREACGIE